MILSDQFSSAQKRARSTNSLFRVCSLYRKMDDLDDLTLGYIDLDPDFEVGDDL